jgi:hypothetical protein
MHIINFFNVSEFACPKKYRASPQEYQSMEVLIEGEKRN